jgi:hypothetical protein
MTDSLAKNFKMRLKDFCSYATNIRIFENPFSAEVNNAAGILQTEQIQLQYNSIYTVVSTRKLQLPFMFLNQYQSSRNYIS